MKELISLHKYWLNADAVRVVVDNKINVGNGLPEALIDLAKFHSSFARMSVFYGLLYVVIEGYKELTLTDEKVDELLAKEAFVDALRLFRNSTFHYQKQPITEKALKFLELPESEIWIKRLHQAFKNFFEASLPIDETLNKLAPP